MLVYFICVLHSGPLKICSISDYFACVIPWEGKLQLAYC